MSKLRSVLPLLGAPPLFLTGCVGDDADGGAGSDETGSSSETAGSNLSGPLTVFAAASLTDVFTGRHRSGGELADLIAGLNLFLRGWGNYFRTGNAAAKFVQLDRYVVWRLKRLLIKKRGRNPRAGQADRWTPAWFSYPKAA